MSWFRRGKTSDSVPAQSGPFDVRSAPDDAVARLDLGSVRLPLPDGAQIQLEVDPDRTVRQVHVLTSLGQLTVSAFAAPPSGGLWPAICAQLVDDEPSMQSARTEPGEWGLEVVGEMQGAILRFIGVDGPGWMVRGVAAAKPRSSHKAAAALRDIIRGTIVVRGTDDLPDRTPLPITLPPEIAQSL